MKLAYWMYAGPAHIGCLRVASSFKNVHAIMHAPLGDDYFNVMRSMLERERDFTPVTASIVDRHVLARGSQEKVVDNITRKDKEECPDLIILTPTCTSSILQEDLQNFVNRAVQETDCDILLADLNHYRVNELQAADKTLEQIVRYYLEKAQKQNDLSLEKTKKPSANIIGILTLGFHNQHDCRELKRLLNDLGIEVNEVIPEGGFVTNIKNLTKAWFNIVPYREVGSMAAVYLEKKFQMPYINITPMGVVDTANFIREIEKIIKLYCQQRPTVDESRPIFKFDEAMHHLDNSYKNESNAVNSKLSTVTTSLGDDIVFNEAVDRSQLVNDISEDQLVPRTTEKNVESKTFDGILQAENINSFFSVENRRFSTVFSKAENKKSALTENDTTINFENYIDKQTRFISQGAWFSRSIDCQNLTGKKTVVFGDATHAASITKILTREMGIRVALAGTYCKHDADWFREQVVGFCDQVLITDDHTQVGDMIAQIEPAAIFGTQMERHVGKRLDIPCGVISAPVHIQNFPLGYRPFLGYEGTNQIADLVYNSFTLGMEDHLLSIFGGHDNKEVITKSLSTDSDLSWSIDGKAELNKIPGFVRGKVKRNTEKFARQNNISLITVEVMFAAKEAVGA